MAIQSISQLKAWFLKGLKPLESQFHDWMDSYWHKEEKIPMSSVDGLNDVLNTKGDTAAFQNLAQEINQQFSEIKQEIYNELSEGLDGVQKTGKLKPVIGIIDPNAESETPEYALSAMSSIMAGTSKVAVQTLLDRYNNSEETHGTMSVVGTAGTDTDSSTTSVVPFSGNNIFNLKNAKSGLEFQINAQIANLEIQTYSTGNRAISILADGVPLAGSPFSVQSGSIIRIFTHTQPVQVGTLSILNTGGGGGVYVADVSFGVAGASVAPGLPEDAEAGDRYIVREEDEDRIMEWNGEEWIEEDTGIEAIEVNVLTDNAYSYKKIAGRFTSWDKKTVEDLNGLGVDVGSLDERLSTLENKPAPELPELATVATTGSYNDLKDKPAIPTLPGNIETTTGAQTKADTAEQNANAYTDGKIGALEIPHYTAPEALPQIEKAGDLPLKDSNTSSPLQEVDFDFSEGNLDLDFSDFGGDTSFELNIKTENVQAGDVRYMTIKGANNSQFGLGDLRINGIYYDELNDVDDNNGTGWYRTDQSPNDRQSFEDKIWIFKFTCLKNDLRFVELKTITKS